MVMITLRDVLWRRRRFLVALLATALVLALTLLLDGVSRSFPAEAHRFTDAFQADGWVVPDGSTSVFMSPKVMPDDTEDEVAAVPGVTATEAIAMVPVSLVAHEGDDPVNATVVGVSDGDMPKPELADGRWPSAPGEITAEKSVDVDLGDKLQLSGADYTVVGHTDGYTYLAGTPISFTTLAQAQELGYNGAELATAIVIQGQPQGLPAELDVLSNDDVVDDLLVPISSARQTIQLILDLLWVVAVMVIGSVVYLTSIDRTRDFAVMKATGATNGALLGGLSLQAGLLSGSAAVLAAGFAQLMAPYLPLQTEIQGSSYLVLLGVALGVAVVSSLVSVRRTMGIDPALAFGGA